MEIKIWLFHCKYATIFIWRDYKKLLILLGLTVSLSANAGLLWFGLGAASSGKPKPIKSELEVQINQISNLLFF